MALVEQQAAASPKMRENRGKKPADKNGVDPLKIHVSGYPPYTRIDDLKEAFADYKVKHIKTMKNFAIISMADAQSSQDAIANSDKICVYGEFLSVKPFSEQDLQRNRRVFVKSKEKNVIIEPSKIELSGDFLQQLDQVLAAVRLTKEEVTRISKLYSDLQSVLSSIWPGCHAYPFGSITTGLGIKTSDADCFVDLPIQFKYTNMNHVNKAKRILQQYPQIFTEIYSIPNAHTPIVKFFYKPTETNCDVSFKTLLGVRNSKLIAFLLHADPRLLPAAVLVKYWAKVHGFSGSGRLTNYALTMLLIFYLQQKPVSILPSVAWLQRDSSKDLIVDEWNTGFVDRHDLLPKVENESPISEIIGGFFEYYATFNFDEMVVCPFLGYPIKKAAFADLDTLPEELSRYKSNLIAKTVLPMKFTTSMCVQDPLELCHNVASSVGSRLAVEIKAYFKLAAATYQREKSSGCVNLLRGVLLEKPPEPPGAARTEYRANVHAKELDRIPDDEWKSVIRNVLKVMFEQICHAPLEPVETKHEGNRHVELYASDVKKAVWKRKRFTRLYGHMPGSFLDKQIRISQEILATDRELHDLRVALSVSFPRETRNAALQLRYLDGDKTTFQEFGKFFIIMVKGWFFVLMRPFLKAKKTNGAVADDPQQDKDAEIEEKIDLTNGLLKEGDLNGSEVVTSVVENETEASDNP
ncbi:speckle targeted PIP5K1A-regulated poly(A) polymerase-like isoform X2 [Colias croceus]|uniref:speckle targeted PIP5K1A-regulated poly(A) polymerase-like isoform X2 n=1 Tax=Colias crocea TaxID=72248 RepID=UPI001E27CB53|nr:speckle targeted PIP5K1A-regulated poly(A) polymerase-like isoform X2 [Colias croceus]